jgi:hypothetical protein
MNCNLIQVTIAILCLSSSLAYTQDSNVNSRLGCDDPGCEVAIAFTVGELFLTFVPTDRMRQIDPIRRLAAGPPPFVIIGGSVCWLLSVSSTFQSTVHGTSQHQGGFRGPGGADRAVWSSSYPLLVRQLIP